jgi:hypothetical protein
MDTAIRLTINTNISIYCTSKSKDNSTWCTPSQVARARILKHFKVTAEKVDLGKVNFSSGILKQPAFPLTAVRHCVAARERQLECIGIHEDAGIVRKISFQAKSYFFRPYEMFKNSGSGLSRESLPVLFF